jgi:hypothetical protein
MVPAISVAAVHDRLICVLETVAAVKFVGAVGEVTVKVTPLLATPPAVTTTFPVVAPDGTYAVMAVALQLVGVAVVPLKVTVLVPCVAPKFWPVSVTKLPTGPAAGLRLVMFGGHTIPKLTSLLDNWLTTTEINALVVPGEKPGIVTTMLVSLQLFTVAAVEPTRRIFEPWVAPKLVPVIVTWVPTGPDKGFKPVMVGAGVWTRVIVAVADLVLSAFEVAVTTTVGGFGGVAGDV